MRRSLVGLVFSLLYTASALTAQTGSQEPAKLATLNVDLWSIEASGSPVHVTLRAKPVAIAGAVAELGGKPAQEMEFSVLAPGTTSLSLPAGASWQLQVETEQYWSQAAWVTLWKTESIRIQLYPTERVTGKLKSSDSTELPAEMGLRFTFSEHRLDRKLGLQDTVKCPIRDKIWSCRIPRGTLDLRLRIPGFVSHFLWDQKVTADRVLYLSERSFVRGASLTGLAHTEDDTPLLKECSVVLAPQAGKPTRPNSRIRAMAEKTSFSPWGFFHLGGVAPGSYLLEASCPGFAPISVPGIVIIAGKEASLHNDLIFRKPVDTTFLFSPTTDIAGQSWKVDLWEDGPIPKRVAGGQTDPAGNWSKNGLQAGEYRLMVRDSADAQVASEEITVADDSRTFPVEIRTIWVEGKVTLAEEGVVASLYFGGASGLISIPMSSDEEGNFTGYLPREGEWSVDVKSHTPRIYRRLRGVEVTTSQGGVAYVEIELPDTQLEVEVVDESGEPLAGATVVLLRSPATEKPTLERADRDGVCSFRGLGYADYRLEAHARSEPPPLRADPVVVTLSEDAPSTSVQLVARAQARLWGRVVSTTGSGVPGVRILIDTPVSGDLRGMVVPNADTDQDGAFEVQISQGVERVRARVLAPGFVLQLLDLAVGSAQEQLIRLHQEGGGALTVELSERSGQSFSDTLYAHLTYDGQYFFDTNELALWARVNGQPEESKEILHVPLMPPGHYEACWRLKDERKCSEGFLPPAGTLELTIPEPGTKIALNGAASVF